MAETGYETVAERPLDPADYPGVDGGLLVPGSAVFQATAGPVPLDDPARWWAYVPGARWSEPLGPDSGNGDLADHPVVQAAMELFNGEVAAVRPAAPPDDRGGPAVEDAPPDREEA